MNPRLFLNPFLRLRERFARLEEVMSRRVSMLIFLVIRFVLMSAMVVGFTWTSLQLSP